MSTGGQGLRVTQSFAFSASYSTRDKVISHNYGLRATFDLADPEAADRLREKIIKEIIDKVHSRDLGEHVDLFQGVPLSGPVILKGLWTKIERLSGRSKLVSLSLQCGKHTAWSLHG